MLVVVGTVDTADDPRMLSFLLVVVIGLLLPPPGPFTLRQPLPSDTVFRSALNRMGWTPSSRPPPYSQTTGVGAERTLRYRANAANRGKFFGAGQ